MKKFLLLMSFCFTMSSLFSQATRTVLVEEFTQASCGPCATQNPAFNTLLQANADRVIAIKYQTSWPGFDPMNEQNPDDVQVRVDYYGVSGVPTAWIDGFIEPTGGSYAGAPANVTQAMIDMRAGETTPLEMTLTHEVAGDLSMVSSTVTITNAGATALDPTDVKLHVYLLEDEIQFASSPGSNGETEFFEVFRAAFTDIAGMQMDQVLEPGMTLTFDMDMAMPDYLYSLNEVSVVAFLQNDGTTEVLQAVRSEPQTLAGFPDYSVSDFSISSPGLCDYGFTPSCLVINNANEAFSGFSVDFLLNGNVVETITNDDELAAGGSTNIMFTATELEGGSNTVTYTVTSTGIGDIAPSNNTTAPVSFNKLSKDGLDNFEISFEGELTGAVPAKGLVTAPDVALVFRIANADDLALTTGPIGGYGLSDNAVMVNFYQWNPATASAVTADMVIIDKLTVPAVGTKFSFDKAFTTWGGSTDRLDVEVSSDCGTTWTSIWSESGSTLATAPEQNTDPGYFSPTADQWETVDIFLDDYVDQTIALRYVAYTSWGDQLYIDNINLSNPVGTFDVDVLDEVVITPNPATDFANVEFTLTETSNVRMTVINSLGQAIAVKNLGELSGYNNLPIDIQDLNNGMFLIQLEIGEGVVTKKLSINR